jgi:probable rRNA maturation factor
MMNNPIDISVLVEDDRWIAALDPVDAESLVAKVVSNVQKTPEWPRALTESTELSVLFADNAAVQELNREWRGKDKPTNILSFPSLPDFLPDAPDLTGKNPPLCLGDMALAFETVAFEAKNRDILFLHHVMHLLVHGLLHLIGHDHEEDDQAEKMERLEIAILAGMGIDNPYRFDQQGEKTVA